MSDLIDRQAAIEALKPCAGVGNRALDKLRALPSAGAHWIPCSERLPDREGRYLVTLPLVNAYPWLRILRYGVPDFDEEYRRRCWYETGDYCDIAVDGIAAWMPLPEPYKEARG